MEYSSSEIDFLIENSHLFEIINDIEYNSFMPSEEKKAKIKEAIDKFLNANQITGEAETLHKHIIDKINKMRETKKVIEELKKLPYYGDYSKSKDIERNS